MRFGLKGILAVGLLASVAGSAACAQQQGVLDPKPPPPLANPSDPSLPARDLFGRATGPASLAARSIGWYAKGCLAGAQALPVDGEAWQVMRLSRNRNWGHPALISLLEGFAKRVPSVSGWRGLLVGDISQPRGGPMFGGGHASHQIGLDADIWLTPMPDHTLSAPDRETMSAVNMVREDWLDIDPRTYGPGQMAVVKAAAQERQVERIFVNPAIKKAMCRDAGDDRAWLHKVRPMFGHNYHFHVRIACPPGETVCTEQDPIPPGEGCDASLDHWFSDAVLHPKPASIRKKPRPPMTLAQLPAACRQVLVAK